MNDVLSGAAIAKLLEDHFSYLPGWTFEINDTREGIVLVVMATVANAYHPDEVQHLRIVTWIPPLPEEKQLWRWLDWRLERVALHEHREWFRIDGKPYSDPHAEIECLPIDLNA